MPRLREREQARQRGGRAGERGVEVEALEIFEQIGGRSPALGEQRRHQPMARVGQEAAGVGEDDLQVRVAPDGAALDEPIRRARGVEQEVGGEGRDARERPGPAAPRVYEHHGVPAVELGEQRLVGRRRRDSGRACSRAGSRRCAEHVEGVLELLERAVHVGQRERREEAEAARMIADDVAPRTRSRGAPSRAPRPLRARSDRGARPASIPRGSRVAMSCCSITRERFLGGPRRQLASARFVHALRAQPRGVRRRHDVLVHVDAAARRHDRAFGNRRAGQRAHEQRLTPSFESSSKP